MSINYNSHIIGLILHFRTPEKTLLCLNSMHSEGITKAIIVDNSEDEGQSIQNMLSSLDKLKQKGFITEIIGQNKNLGFASGVSMGLQYISINCPNHVLLINSDAHLEKGSLIELEKQLSRAQLFAPSISQQGNNHTSPIYYYDKLTGIITKKPLLMPLRYPSGCCLLIHSNIIHLEIFDKDFFFYGEDMWLGQKVTNQDFSLLESKEAKIYHATSSSSQNGSLFYEYHMNRAHWLLAKKLSKNKIWYFIFIFMRCITLSLRATIRCMRNRSLNAWYGLGLATYDLLMGKFRSLTPKPK